MIVTPALTDANNGNWQTARRWARLLRPAYRVRLAAQWDGGDDSLMIALHARRSAASVAAWRAAAPRRPLVLVLTGTDLYRDIDVDATAASSLVAADRLVVLNRLGAQRLPPALRGRCRVVLQSCASRQALAHTDHHLRALMVGHLRPEKDPQTCFRAIRRLAARHDVLLDHIGQALDAALGDEAATLAYSHPQYRWLGGLPHGRTRERIQKAHLLVHPSRMEGGAHVVIEAIRSGTPVIASRIDGNVGLLGGDYGGYFPPGDDAALATLLERARDDADMLPALREQIAQCAPRFAPEAEREVLHAIVAELLASPNPGDRR